MINVVGGEINVLLNKNWIMFFILKINFKMNKLESKKIKIVFKWWKKWIDIFLNKWMYSI